MSTLADVQVQVRIAAELQSFLRGKTAAHTLAGTRSDPLEPLGEIFLKLSAAYHKDVQNLERWVAVNAQFYLRNWRRTEKRRRLLQIPERSHEDGR